MKKTLIISLFVLLFLWPNAYAQSDNFEFLNFHYSPKSAAMGGVGSVFIGDPSLIYENPIALYGTQREAGVAYSNHLLDISGAFAYFALPYKFSFMQNDGYLAFFLLDMNYGEVDAIDEYGNPLNQTYSANDFALGISYTSILDERFYYGANLKLAYSSIADYSSSAVLMDFSLRYDIPRSTDLSAIVTLRNMGFFLSNYTDARQNVPFQLEIGMVKKLAHLPLRFAFSLIDVFSGKQNNLQITDRWKFGGEFQIHPNVAIRLGYNRLLHSSLVSTSGNTLTGVSFGAGVKIRQFRLDGSWTNWGDVGTVSQFGINYQF